LLDRFSMTLTANLERGTSRFMKRGFLLLVVTSCLAGATPANSQTLWKNGRWFDGTTFVSRDMYSDERGLLSADRPAKVRQTVDLNGGFVVPAYGDAHHHGIDRAEGLKPKINAFLRAGIFYVKNPNVIPDFLTPALRSQIGETASTWCSLTVGSRGAAGIQDRSTTI
jgi:hypothetical protein